MRDIVKFTADLQARISSEVEALLAERAGVRDILEARLKELTLRREAELKRIDQWAVQQKAAVSEVFGAMVDEAKADLESNASLMARIGGELAVKARPTTLRTLNKTAEAFAKAAE